jgi:hypothetical protein
MSCCATAITITIVTVTATAVTTTAVTTTAVTTTAVIVIITSISPLLWKGPAVIIQAIIPSGDLLCGTKSANVLRKEKKQTYHSLQEEDGKVKKDDLPGD